MLDIRHTEITPFSTRLYIDRDWAVTVEVFGEVDIATVERLGAALYSVPDDATTVVLDFRGVTLLSAAGVGAIVKFVNEMSDLDSNPPIAVLASPETRMVLEICGLDSLIDDPDRPPSDGDHAGGRLLAVDGSTAGGDLRLQ